MSDLNVPPQNLDAEENVLGAMMMSPSAITAVSDVVRPADFYRESHAVIFQAALDLDARGEPVDALTLSAELVRRGEMTRAGGKVRIQELAATVPASANAGHYAKIVRDTATRRALIEAGSTISTLGWQGHGETGDLLSSAEDALSNVGDLASDDTNSFNLLSSEVSRISSVIIQAAERGEKLFGVRTGIPTLDKITTGLRPGTLTVLAARPAMGKSVLAQTITTNVADRGIGVAFLTLEMSKAQLSARWLAKLTNISTTDILTANITVQEREKIEAAVKEIAGRPIYVEDNAALTMPEIRARVRRLAKRNKNLGLIVVDYIQLMLSATNADSRQQEVANLSRSLKLLAKELHVPILAVSQLNRNLEGRPDKRPTLSDLRDSGAIEQDADIVLFLYRDFVYDKTIAVEKQQDTELIVAKNRMGEAHKTIDLVFLARRQMFSEPAKG